MGEIGLMGIAIPEEYGGAAMDALAYSLVMEEISRTVGAAYEARRLLFRPIKLGQIVEDGPSCARSCRRRGRGRGGAMRWWRDGGARGELELCQCADRRRLARARHTIQSDGQHVK